MAHYKDLREVYSKEMEFHGFGHGLYKPMAADDIQPPCCGFFDRNGDWNLIANLEVEQDGLVLDEHYREGLYKPLVHKPDQCTTMKLVWQAKTSRGTESLATNTSVDTPDNLPGGATGQLRYQTRNKFGAVLMACKPISLVAYNAERLFLQWLDANRAQLYQLHGKQLREYGFWLVTRSYSAPSASINAWLNAKTQISISAKAKASMLGNLGQKLSYTDSDQDSGWTHYISKTDKGITLFIDGLFVSSWDWKLEGLKLSLPKIGNAEESPHERHGEFQRRRMSSMQLDVDQSWSSKENRANEKDRRRSHDTSAQPITRKPSEMKPGQKTVSRAEYAPIPNPPLRNHHDNSNLHVPLRSRHSSSQRATWYSAHDTTEGGQQEQEHEAKDHDDSRSNHSHQTERPSRDNTAEARQFSGETNVNRESHNGNRSSRDFSSSMPPSIDVQGVDPSVLKDLGINHTLSRTQSMHSQLRQESLPRSPISSRVPSLRHESRRLSLEQSSEH